MSFRTVVPKVAAGVALAGTLAGGSVYATTENVVAEVEFIAPITLTENATLSFGRLSTLMVGGDTVTINTDDSYTQNQPTNVAGGVQQAADLTVTATAGQAIDIEIQNVSVPGGVYTLGGWTCRYAGGADGVCDPGTPMPIAGGTVVGSSTIEVGATLTAGAVVAGVQNGSFDVVVLYQ